LNYSISVLTKRESNRMLKLLRLKGIKPPKKGYGISAFGGSVLHHGSIQLLPWQVISIDAETYNFITRKSDLHSLIKPAKVECNDPSCGENSCDCTHASCLCEPLTSSKV
jgi:hypothetical protein